MSNYTISFGEKKRKWWHRALKTLVVLILLAVSFFLGMYLPGKNEKLKTLAKNEAIYLGNVAGIGVMPHEGKISQDIDFNLFWNVWDELKKDYVDKDKMKDKELFYGAIRGMVASVGDPYTIFMDPQVAQEFSNDLAGTFSGIGTEIGIRHDILTVVAPLDGSPADIAGIKAGDKIYAINGTSTINMSIDGAVRLIRGPKGTEVTLSIVRAGLDKPKDFKIVRDNIVVKSVKTKEKDGMFIIEVSNFNNDTMDLFNKAVTQAVELNPKGIILDLRNNPGGYLETAIDMASQWVEDGVIVSEKFSDTKKNDFSARGRARLKDFKTVVLVNQGSASASEIVSGALKDHKKATIVGKQTFGKGSVQSLNQFTDGSSLKVTIAKWLTPNGDCINEIGIKPDVEVDLKPEDINTDKDPQMDKAFEILKAQK